MAAPNTLVSRVITKEELCLLEKIPPPCGVVIFGASGDLTHRKLLPALFELSQENLLPKNFYILGVARSPLNDETFRATIKKSLPASAPSAARDAFLSRCTYLSGDYGDPKTYAALQQRLTGLDKVYDTGGRHLFYLSMPPELYGSVVQQLGAAGLAAGRGEEGWVRVVVEKPFGYNHASGEQLYTALHQVFQENQIYPIDHYLGKETVQNMLMFRFANAIFEPVWNRKYIDHVQITAAESDGVGHRAGYYEKAGALRDMFQNHLLQLLSLVAMEPPCSFEADCVRDEKAKVMETLNPLKESDYTASAIRAQYAAGRIGDDDARQTSGEASARFVADVPAYRREEGVAPNSTTETFAALRVTMDNWRWQGVPFYLRSGKRLARRETEVAVQFKHVPASIFKPLMADQMSPNVLSFRIQPDEGISLRFEAKHPGPKLCMSSVTMLFNYEEAFGLRPPEAYTRLFLDVMLGDQTLFSRHDWLARSWSFLDPLLDFWNGQGDKGLAFYPAGSWGPPAATDLIQKEGREWLMM